MPTRSHFSDHDIALILLKLALNPINHSHFLVCSDSTKTKQLHVRYCETLCFYIRGNRDFDWLILILKHSDLSKPNAPKVFFLKQSHHSRPFPSVAGKYSV